MILWLVTNIFTEAQCGLQTLLAISIVPCAVNTNYDSFDVIGRLKPEHIGASEQKVAK